MPKLWQPCKMQQHGCQVWPTWSPLSETCQRTLHMVPVELFSSATLHVLEWAIQATRTGSSLRVWQSAISRQLFNLASIPASDGLGHVLPSFALCLFVPQGGLREELSGILSEHNFHWCGSQPQNYEGLPITSTHGGHPLPTSPLLTGQGVSLQSVSLTLGQIDNCFSCHSFRLTEIVPSGSQVAQVHTAVQWCLPTALYVHACFL